MDKVAEKLGNILEPNKNQNVESIDNLIKQRVRNLDSFYFHEEFFSQLCYCSTLDAYIIYLQDALFEIALKRPEILRSQEKITIEEILEQQSNEELIHHIARRKVTELSNSGLNGLLSFFTEKLGIACLNTQSSCTTDIITLHDIRNCFVHNNGVIGDIFARRNPNYAEALGKKIRIDTRFGDNATQCLLFSVKQIDEIVINKFGVASEHKNIEDVLKSITEKLPPHDKFSNEILSVLKELKNPKHMGTEP